MASAVNWREALRRFPILGIDEAMPSTSGLWLTVNPFSRKDAKTQCFGKLYPAHSRAFAPWRENFTTRPASDAVVAGLLILFERNCRRKVSKGSETK